MSAYYVSVTLHVLAALFWLGGMFFLAAVGAPVLRRIEPPALRAELFRDFGLGPAAARAQSGSPAALALRRWSAWIARVNALLGLILVVAAVRVARGG